MRREFKFWTHKFEMPNRHPKGKVGEAVYTLIWSSGEMSRLLKSNSFPDFEEDCKHSGFFLRYIIGQNSTYNCHIVSTISILRLSRKDLKRLYKDGTRYRSCS